MKKMDNELIQFHITYAKYLNELEKEHPFIIHFYDSFLAGQTELYQKETKETKIFDEEWIETIESYFPSLNNIIRNPFSGIKVIEEVSPIEKARKINSRSIKHLAANTHLLKEVKEDGTVIPSSILTNYTDINYELYENRFIMTLIDRLFVFVRTRYNVIKENVESFDKRQVKIKSTFPINNSKVDFNLDITLIDEIDNKEINIYNQKLLNRVEELNKLVTSLKTSNFMNEMKDARRIHPPIMKTNIILKNRNYHNAYLLWLFMDKYNTLPYSLDIEDKDLSFDDHYLKDIQRQALSMFSTIVYNHENSKEKYKTIEPKVQSFESIKVITDEPGDIKESPEDIVIEEQVINEYFLETYKKIFASSIEKYEANTKTETAIIKKALRDTVKISNALYESYFDLDSEVDIFEHLINKTNVTEELENTRRKIRIAQIVREVKQVDYNDSLRLERRLLAELGAYYDHLLREQIENIKSEKAQLELEKANDERQKLIAISRDNLEQELEAVKAKRDEINELRINNLNEIRSYQTELNNKRRAEILEFTKKLDNKTQEKIDVLNKEYESFKKDLKIKEDDLIKAEEKRLKEALEKIKEESLKAYNEEKLRLEEQQQKEILQRQADLKIAKLVALNDEAIEEAKRKAAEEKEKRERETLKKAVLKEMTPLTESEIRKLKLNRPEVEDSKEEKIKEIDPVQLKEREALKQTVLKEMTPLTKDQIRKIRLNKPEVKESKIEDEKQVDPVELQERESLKKIVLKELGPFTEEEFRRHSRRKQ